MEKWLGMMILGSEKGENIRAKRIIFRTCSEKGENIRAKKNKVSNLAAKRANKCQGVSP